MVKVQIRISERVFYEREVEMTEEEYNNYCYSLSCGTLVQKKNTEKIAELFINRRDNWLDADDLEIEEFRKIEQGRKI